MKENLILHSREELVDFLVDWEEIHDVIRSDIDFQKTFTDANARSMLTVFSYWLSFCLYCIEKRLPITDDPWELAKKVKKQYPKAKIWQNPTSKTPALIDAVVGVKLKDEMYQRLRDLEDETLSKIKTH